MRVFQMIGRTWEIGQGGLATNECGAGETSTGGDGSGGPRSRAQGRCAEESGVHDGFN